METQLMQAPTAHLSRRVRRGFSLIETLISVTLLSGVVLMLGMGTTSFSRSLTDTGVRSRAQARADAQIALARSWPTWGTLEALSDARFNGTSDGLTTTTTVSANVSGLQRIKRITVVVTSTPSHLMPVPVRRSISVAAP